MKLHSGGTAHLHGHVARGGHLQQHTLHLVHPYGQPCVRLCRTWLQAPAPQHSKTRRQPPLTSCSAASSSRSSSPSGQLPSKGELNNLSQLIADVLNEERSAQTVQTQTDLLGMIDSLGAGVSSSVTRTWEGRDAWLQIQGTWAKGVEARKFAMLAVYHERIWQRDLQLGRLFQLMLRHRPGVIPQEAADRVSKGIAGKPFGGACESLNLMDLLLLSVACLELQQLHQEIQAASDAAWQELKDEVWVFRDPLRAAGLQVQLSSMCSSWRYQVQLCLIRLHHAPGIAAVARYLDDMQRKGSSAGGGAGRRSLWAGSGNAAGESGSKSGSQSKVPDEAIGTAEVNFIAGQLGAFVREGLTGPLCGRVGWVGFGRGGTTREDSGGGLRRNCAGRPRGSLARDGGVVGGAGFGADVIAEFREVYLSGEESRVARGQIKAFSHGAAILYERQLRKRLIDALCAWADTRPELVAVTPLQPHCTHSTRIGTLSTEHVGRHVMIRCQGAELTWLRQQAQQHVSGFLQHWDPYLGNPFKGKQEWEYNDYACAVWNRLCYFPPELDSAKLTLFWRHPATAPPPDSTTTATASSSDTSAARQQTDSKATWDQADITLTLSELRAFMAVLLDLVPAIMCVSSGQVASKVGGKPGSWLGPAGLQIRYSPVSTAATGQRSPNTSGSTDSSFQAAAYEIRWLESSNGGNSSETAEVQQYKSARLMASHIQSLVNIYEDVSSRLPDLLPVPAAPSTLTLSDAPSHSSRWLTAAAQLVGAAALLACIPLGLALRASRDAGEPFSFQTLQKLPAVTYQAVQRGLSSSSSSGSQQQPTASPGSHSASLLPANRPIGLQPANAVLDSQQLAALCESVRSSTDLKMWLPVKDKKQQDKEGNGQETAAEASKQQRKALQLMYQVVVSREGQVLGCMPCDAVSASWYAHLPLSTAVRDAAAQQQQAKLLEACQPGGNKPGQLPGTFPGLTRPATYAPLPRAPSTEPEAAAVADVAVLALRLHQETDKPETLGEGKSAMTMAAMRAQVTPWTLVDSVTMWAAQNVDVVDLGSHPSLQPTPDDEANSMTEAQAGCTTDAAASHQGDAAGQVINLKLAPDTVAPGSGGGWKQVDRVLHSVVQQLVNQIGNTGTGQQAGKQ